MHSKCINNKSRGGKTINWSVCNRGFFSGWCRYYHGSACPAPFPITAHALTWFPLSLIELTYLISWINLLDLQSLTATLHKLTHLSHSSAGLKVSRLQGSLHWSMSAYLPVRPGTRPCLWKRKFTYSDTVHPASRAFFAISLMLEALPELYWINYLLTCIYLSVSLTSIVTEDQPLKTRWSSPPTSSPLSGGISHSRSIPENSAGSLQGQKSTMRQSSSCFDSGQITIALWISQTPQECVGERVSTGV